MSKSLPVIALVLGMVGCQAYHGGPPTIVDYGGDRDYIWPDHSLCGDISGGPKFLATDWGPFGDQHYFLREQDAIAWLETKCTPKGPK